MRILATTAIALSFLLPVTSQADEIAADMSLIDTQGTGAAIGRIVAKDASTGVIFIPSLKGLPPGEHGFHVHEFPDCGAKDKEGKSVPGLAAGSHYDPAGTGKHLGPAGVGHLGDLPVLTVAADGTAQEPVTAGRLKVDDLRGRALMIHADPDNYGDQPGGARIACGVLK